MDVIELRTIEKSTGVNSGNGKKKYEKVRRSSIE